MRVLSPCPYRVFQRGVPLTLKLWSEKRPTACRVLVREAGSEEPVFEGTLPLFEGMAADSPDCGAKPREGMAADSPDSAAKRREGMAAGGGGLLTASLSLPAGGWYTITVTAAGEQVTVSPFGVGEVFVIAGQSHATNSNNRQFRVREPQGRITVYDPADGSWRVAHDRQPCYDSSEYNARFGSLWPVTFDALFERLRLPVGMTNAAYGATALFQWMPGHESRLFENLLTCCRAAGQFRAILWQQGESDVMWRTETADYVAGMKRLKASLEAALGFGTRWLVAKSTIHPSVYHEPEQEEKIRAADDILWQTEGFFPGPDTDTLTGDCRDAPQTFSGHLTEKGQLLAGAMWAECLAGFIKRDSER